MPSSAEQNLPATNEGYGTKEYWEQRYTNEPPSTTFDWFLSPTYLLPMFEELAGSLGKNARILMLGCGNSALGEVMYDAGYKHITNVDYSATLIEHMIARHQQARPEMKWLEMDVLDLKFSDGDFDLVVDKGTMDAMLTTKGDPWNPNQKDIDACTQEVTEGLRVLKKAPTSKFIYFTFGQPHFRKRYLINRPGWAYSQKEVGPPDGFDYFLYVLSYEGDAQHS